MNARAVDAVAKVIDASMRNGKRTPAGWACDLYAAGLVMSPEAAAEFERLRAREAELEQELAALKAQGQVLRKTRQVETGRREVADGEHYPFVHHTYLTGHDLPELGGAS